MNERTEIPVQTEPERKPRKAAAGVSRQPAAAPAPPRAACGSDDLMSEPQEVPIAGGSDVAWSTRVAAVADHWRRLNVRELAALDGDERQLTRLIARRYAIARSDAARQVRDFFRRSTA